MPCLFIDVSSLARWTGPPVGMIRVQAEIVCRAAGQASVRLVFFDQEAGVFRPLLPPWDTVVLGAGGCIDLWRPRGWRRWRPSRYSLYLALERRRLMGEGRRAALAAGLQRVLLGLRRHTLVIKDAAGRRLSRVPQDLVLGPAAVMGPGDVLLLAGSGWYHVPAAPLAALQARLGFRVAALCYDVIPLQRPDWFPPDDAAAFRTWWHRVLGMADRVIVSAAVIGADVARVCAAEHLVPPDIQVVPLGAWPAPPAATPPAPLPEGLQPGRFALFVSTIEPRKGHALLLRAWRRLMEAGIAGPGGFRLVLVGRAGWMVDATMAEIAACAAAGAVVHLPSADDAVLRALYDGAAFCLYPSEYEGFGLPVIEAFAHGKPVIASNAGALPEAAGGLACCLDPHDTRAWERAIAAWITRPDLLHEAAVAVVARFALRDWDTAASALLEAARTSPTRLV